MNSDLLFKVRIFLFNAVKPSLMEKNCNTEVTKAALLLVDALSLLSNV